MKLLLSLLMILSSSITTFAAEDAGKVVLSLKQYQKLIDVSEKTSMHVIENMTLKGSFPDNVSIEIKGQYTNKPKAITFIQSFQHAVKNCKGDAIISSRSSNLSVFPLKNRYTVSCDLIIKSKQSFSLRIKNVMNFDNKLSKAEAILDGNPTSYLTVQILRKEKKVATKKAETIRTGRYKIYVGSNSTTFEYIFGLNNPNRNKVTENITWPNGEIIKQVYTDLDYSEKNGTLSVNLNPGNNNVVVSGSISAKSFNPIFSDANQYFMIENHAIIQVKSSTKWRRISNSESGLNATKPSAKSYLVSNANNISWSVKKLKLFSSTGFTVKRQNIDYYVPKDGQPIVNMTYSINNQGPPEIPLKIEGKVTYLEVNGTAAPLYKDDKDNLLVSIPQGNSSVLVQYRPKMEVAGVFSVIESEFSKPKAVVSNSQLAVKTPREWDLYFGSFNKDFESILKMDNIIEAIVLMFIMYFALVFLKIRKSTVLPLIISMAALKLFRHDTHIYMYLLTSLLYIIHYRKKIWSSLGKSKVLKFSGVFAVLVLVVVIYAITVPNFKNYQARSNNVMEDIAYDSEGSLAPQALNSARSKRVSKSKMARIGGVVSASLGEGMSSQGGDDDFQGVPARIEMPYSEKNHYFKTNLVNIDGSMKTKLYFVKSYFLDLYILFFSFVIFFTLYRRRSEFLAFL